MITHTDVQAKIVGRHELHGLDPNPDVSDGAVGLRQMLPMQTNKILKLVSFMVILSKTHIFKLIRFCLVVNFRHSPLQHPHQLPSRTFR